MASFDILKTYFEVDRSHPQFQVMNLLNGGLAGTIAVTFTYPTDVARRKLQMVGTPGHPVYKGFIDCLVTIAKTEGRAGLFRGLWPCYLKVAPSVAILFWCNEQLKALL